MRYNPWAVARPAPLSMEFSRQEYWSQLLLPTPRDLPDSGIEFTSLESPVLAGRFLTTSAAWKSVLLGKGYKSVPGQSPLGEMPNTSWNLLNIAKSKAGSWALGVKIQATTGQHIWLVAIFTEMEWGIRLERGRVLPHLLCTHTIVIKHQGAFKIWKPCRGFLLPTHS